MIKRNINILGSRIAYFECGSKHGPVLIMVHGFRGNHRALLPISRELQGFRILLIDLPGYGESTPMSLSHTLKNYSTMLEVFCDKLHLKTFSLWGHSFGGSLCLLFASRTKRNVERIVLVSPALPGKGIVTSLAILYYRIAALLPRRIQKFWLASTLLNDLFRWYFLKRVHGRQRKKLMKDGRAELRDFNADVVIEGFLSFFRSNMLKAAASISVPTTIIAGDLDDLVPLSALETLHKTMPRSCLVVIRGVGHLSPIEQPRHNATLAQKFLWA